MNASLVAQVVANGLLLGGLYALAAAGLNLVFGVMRVINVAHGEFLMLGAYTTFFLYDRFGLNPLVSLPVSAAFTFALGVVVYELVVRRVVGRPELMSLLVTFGVSILFVNLGLYFFEAVFRSVPAFGGSLGLAGINVSKARTAAFLAGIAVCAAVYFFLRLTTPGKLIRATSQQSEVAEACGIDVGKVRRYTFGLGTALGGVAGSLIIFILPIGPTVGHTFILKAFAICVIGGLGSFSGAIAGGLLLGVVEAITSLASSAQIAQGVAYGLLILVLLVRPQGLLGLRPARS